SSPASETCAISLIHGSFRSEEQDSDLEFGGIGFQSCHFDAIIGIWFHDPKGFRDGAAVLRRQVSQFRTVSGSPRACSMADRAYQRDQANRPARAGAATRAEQAGRLWHVGPGRAAHLRGQGEESARATA